MSSLAEAIIAAFDSNMQITWTREGASRVLATFALNESLVITTFDQMGPEEWQVGFTVSPETQSATAVAQSSIRIFGGVFQAVRDFLEVRQPVRLVFASKNESLGSLYESYLKRQDSLLGELGYTMAATRATPLVEFALEKTTPSSWRN